MVFMLFADFTADIIIVDRPLRFLSSLKVIIPYVNPFMAHCFSVNYSVEQTYRKISFPIPNEKILGPVCTEYKNI